MIALIATQSGMITICMIMIIGILSSEGGSSTNQEWFKALRGFTVTVFSIFLIVYVFVLYILTSRLKRYFPKFYLKERPKILTSNGVIIISIVTRISVNIFIYLFQEEMDISYGSGTWFYPIF